MGQYAPTYMTTYDTDGDVLAAPVNSRLPRIFGFPRSGNRMTVSNGGWNANPLSTYTYQWKRGGVNIAGATNQTYDTVVPTDNNTVLTCTVTATNSQGNASATTLDTYIRNP